MAIRQPTVYLLIFLALIILSFPLSGYFSGDFNIYVYGAKILYYGDQVLYKDFRCYRPPLIYIMLVPIYSLFGGGSMAVAYYSTLLFSLLGTLNFYLTRKLFQGNRVTAFWAWALLLLVLLWDYDYGFQQGVVIWPLISIFLASMVLLNKTVCQKHSCIFGILFFLAFFTRESIIPLIIFGCQLLLNVKRDKAGSIKITYATLSFLAAFILCLFAMLIFLQYRGTSTQEFLANYFDKFTYLQNNIQTGAGEGADTGWASHGLLILIKSVYAILKYLANFGYCWFLIVPLFYAIKYQRPIDADDRQRIIALLFVLLVECLSVAFQSAPMKQYIYLLLITSIILLSVIISRKSPHQGLIAGAIVLALGHNVAHSSEKILNNLRNLTALPQMSMKEIFKSDERVYAINQTHTTYPFAAEKNLYTAIPWLLIWDNPFSEVAWPVEVEKLKLAIERDLPQYWLVDPKWKSFSKKGATFDQKLGPVLRTNYRYLKSIKVLDAGGTTKIAVWERK